MGSWVVSSGKRKNTSSSQTGLVEPDWVVENCLLTQTRRGRLAPIPVDTSNLLEALLGLCWWALSTMLSAYELIMMFTSGSVGDKPRKPGENRRSAAVKIMLIIRALLVRY